MARRKALPEERLAVLCKEIGIDQALAIVLTLHAYEKPNVMKKSLGTDPDPKARRRRTTHTTDGGTNDKPAE